MTRGSSGCSVRSGVCWAGSAVIRRRTSPLRKLQLVQVGQQHAVERWKLLQLECRIGPAPARADHSRRESSRPGAGSWGRSEG